MGCRSCNSNSCGCGVQIPYYEDPCFQENQNQGCKIYNQYSPVLRISTGWAVPEASNIVTLKVAALADMLVGATLWNPLYGEYEVVYYDPEGQIIKVVKAEDNTTEVGTVIPSCTKFIVTAPQTVSLDTEDTASVDMTYAAGVLSSNVILSEEDGNILEILEDGLYATGGGGGGITEVTTAELNALVAANDLEVGTTYAITDHVQGRVTAGTRVVVQAMSVNQITSECQVLTEYDTEYWRGVYNLATNQLFELEDNQGNICRQFPDPIFGPFTPIDDFDWGNPNITNCLIDNATWTTTYGLAPTSGIERVVLKGASTLDTTNWTGNYIYNLLITGVSGVDIADSNSEFEEVSFTQSGFITDRSLENNFYFLVNCEHSFISCDEVAASLYIEGVTISGYSGIYHAGTSGSVVIHKAEISGEAEIRIVTGAVIDVVEFLSSSLTGATGELGTSSIRVEGTCTDVIDFYQTEISSGAVVNLDSVAETIIDFCNIGSGAELSISDTVGDILLSKCSMSSEGKITIDDTTFPSILDNCNVASGGTITVNTIGAGDLEMGSCEVSTGGVLGITDGGIISKVNVVQGTLQSGGFDLTNVYILGSGTSTATANNSDTARDYFNDTIV